MGVYVRSGDYKRCTGQMGYIISNLAESGKVDASEAAGDRSVRTPSQHS